MDHGVSKAGEAVLVVRVKFDKLTRSLADLDAERSRLVAQADGAAGDAADALAGGGSVAQSVKRLFGAVTGKTELGALDQMRGRMLLKQAEAQLDLETAEADLVQARHAQRQYELEQQTVKLDDALVAAAEAAQRHSDLADGHTVLPPVPWVDPRHLASLRRIVETISQRSGTLARNENRTETRTESELDREQVLAFRKRGA